MSPGFRTSCRNAYLEPESLLSLNIQEVFQAGSRLHEPQAYTSHNPKAEIELGTPSTVTPIQLPQPQQQPRNPSPQKNTRDSDSSEVDKAFKDLQLKPPKPCGPVGRLVAVAEVIRLAMQSHAWCLGSCRHDFGDFPLRGLRLAIMNPGT